MKISLEQLRATETRATTNWEPSPEEISQACRRIQVTWDEGELQRRARAGVQPFEVQTVSIRELGSSFKGD